MGSAARRTEAKFADQHLALDLQTDKEEKDRHQAIVDPVQQVLFEMEVTEHNGDFGVPELLVKMTPGGIGPDQRDQRTGQEQDATGGLLSRELLERAEYQPNARLIGSLLRRLHCRHGICDLSATPRAVVGVGAAAPGLRNRLVASVG